MSAGTAHVKLLTPDAPRLNPVIEFSKGYPLKGLCHEINNFLKGPNRPYLDHGRLLYK
jgi:hypothetical protein